MCIIVVKKKNIKMPKKEILETCFTNNPDGAGFMYRLPHNNLIKIQKGFMEFEAFYKALQEKKLNRRDEVILHFRIATSGTTCPVCTHPFPISSDIESLKATECITSQAVAHNGVIQEYGTKKESDTMEFIREVLANDIVMNNLRDDTVKELVSRSINGSRLAIMDSKGIILLGTGWVEKRGIMYSNETFECRGFSYSRHYASALWDDEDYQTKPDIEVESYEGYEGLNYNLKRSYF